MKKREITRQIERKKDSKGNFICLIPDCKKISEKYKNGNFRNYCKKHTFWDMREHTNWQELRLKALKRDNNTCVKCGDNRKERTIKIPCKRVANVDGVIYRKEKPIDEIFYIKQVRSNFIGDHIKPIALGGEEFDLKNIQTLCLKCNKIKTSKDIKEIALERKREKIKTKKLK